MGNPRGLQLVADRASERRFGSLIQHDPSCSGCAPNSQRHAPICQNRYTALVEASCVIAQRHGYRSSNRHATVGAWPGAAAAAALA